jgi:hypothetical protein
MIAACMGNRINEGSKIAGRGFPASFQTWPAAKESENRLRLKFFLTCKSHMLHHFVLQNILLTILKSKSLPDQKSSCLSMDLIDVRVMVDKREAIEYNDPSIPDSDDEVVRYVETQPGQNFGVKTILLLVFDVVFNSGIGWIFQEDDQDFTQSNFFDLEEFQHINGILSAAK